MKSSKTLIAITVAALLPLGAAMAGEGKDKSGSMGPSFDTLDTNRDGRISQAEASVDANLVFTMADKNGDGYLDKSEFKSRAKDPTPAPQSSAEPTADPSVPAPASEPAPADTETPRP